MNRRFSRVIASIVLCAFNCSIVFNPSVSLAAPAISSLGLPVPGSMIDLTSAYVPVIPKGLHVHPENPILFDFIVDTGNSKLTIQDPMLKMESEKLIKYFLAALTIPDNDQWVNLSPYEKDRIIPDQLGQTEMGRDMLAQDYILKQLTASLIYPEKELGKEFWSKVYAKAQALYGTSEVPVNTFNKVWITSDQADVYVHENTAYVVRAHLKVMLEEDYLAMTKHNSIRNDVGSIGANIVRDIILPELEKEVNQGKNFANLRQIFYSMILATWYKKNLKEALLNQVYSNQAKINGINVEDKTVKEQIYQQYLQAYKKGVFNYIKEDLPTGRQDIDQSAKQTLSRKYFSGGLAKIAQQVGVFEKGKLPPGASLGSDGAMFAVTTKTDSAMTVTAPTKAKAIGKRTLANSIKMLVLSTLLLFSHPTKAATINDVASELFLSQNQTTGLVVSFRETTNSYMTQQAVTYDQTVAHLAFLSAGRLSESDKIFNFYYNWYRSNMASFTGFRNMYWATTGANGNELDKTSGPNLWVGIMALHQAKMRNDPRGIELAQVIYNWTNTVVHSNGAIAFGRSGIWPGIFATEHNIDYFAFLRMYEPYALPAQLVQLRAKKTAVEGWLKNIAYNPALKLFNRGGASGQDTARASDTTAWALMLGAQTLKSWNINPDELMAQGETSFRVGDQGFDISNLANATGAGRTMKVFGEFTGQFANAYNILAEDAARTQRSGEAEVYANESARYVGLITATGQYPYCESVGVRVLFDNPNWTTVDGKSASVMAWAMLSMAGHNPFDLETKPLLEVLSMSKLANGNMALVIKRTNPEVTSVFVETSSNMVNWTIAAVVSMDQPIVLWEDVSSRFVDRRFYRVQPPSSANQPAGAAPLNLTPPQLQAPPEDGKKDKALVVPTGGIDLNSKNLQLNVNGEKIDIKFDPAMLAQFKRGDFSGLYPVIINISPILSILPILGLRKEDVEMKLV